MSDYQELVTILKELLTNRFYPKPEFIKGLLGDGLGNVLVPDRPDYNYVRFNRSASETFEVFNKEVSQPVDGTPVLIGTLPWQPGLVQVVGIDWESYIQTGWGDRYANIQSHAPTHEWPDFEPGSDFMSVYLRSIYPLRGYSGGTGSMSFSARPYQYDFTGTNHFWPGTPSVDLGPTRPATGTMRYMGVYLNPGTNTLGVVTGASSAFAENGEPAYPAWPLNVFPVAFARVYGGQAYFVERDIKDARRLWNTTLMVTGTSSGGGSWPFGNIKTVSSTNTDADFSTIQDGIDSIAAGGTITLWLDKETFAENLTIDSKKVAIVAQGADPRIGGTANSSFINGTITIRSTTHLTEFLLSDVAAITIDASSVAGSNNIQLYFRRIYQAGSSTRISLTNRCNLYLDDCYVEHTGGGTVISASLTSPSFGVTAYGSVIKGTISLSNGFWTTDAYSWGYITSNPPASNFTIVEKAPTETLRGLAELATQAETNAATDDLRIVTPLKIATRPWDLITVKNTSGGTASVDRVGYLTYGAEGEEFKFAVGSTITNAARACVVVIGGANNATIKVTTRGRFNLLYTGTAPTKGQFLIFSGTSGAVVAQAFMSPDVIAVAMADGSGGVVDALLLTGRKFLPFASSNNLCTFASISGSDFVATQNGAPSGANITYNAPSSGNENTINPTSTDLGKIVIHNTTRGTSAFLVSTNTGTNVMTFSDAADVSGWQNGDTLTARSQTNTDTISSTYFYDIAITTEIPDTSIAVVIYGVWFDTAANSAIRFHPYEAGAASKRFPFFTQAASVNLGFASIPVSLINKRFTLEWVANGAGTASTTQRLTGVWIAVP